MGYKNTTVYASPVQTTSNCYPKEKCFSHRSFCEYELNSIVEQNNAMLLRSKYPHKKQSACCADSENAYVIDADGEMYKCWSDIGMKEYSVGNLKEKHRNLMNQILYMKRDPTTDEKCNRFLFFPVCLGGCPHDIRVHSSDRCIHYEHLHKLYLNKIASIIRQQRKIFAQ